MITKQKQSVELLFRISKPYGYYIEEVNDAIKEYKKAITDLQDVIKAHKAKEKEYLKEIERLQMQVQNLYSQMASMEIPDVDPEFEDKVIQKFKSSNKSPLEVAASSTDIDDIEVVSIDDEKDHRVGEGGGKKSDFGIDIDITE